MNKLAQISLIAGTAGLATAGSLDMDRSYAAELRSDAGAYSVLNGSASNITVSAATRFGYNVNIRDNDALGDNDTTIGFGFQDVEVRLSGQVTDSINATISFDFGPDDQDGPYADGGTANLEDAYADWMINDTFTLRIGQFVQAFSAGRSMSEYHMNGVFRSTTESALGDTGWTQGVEAHFGGDTWSGAIGFTDGPFSSNTAFNSGFEQDYSINARFDFFSDSDKARFADASSWRGSASGWRVGAGVIFATAGDTNPSAANNTDNLWWTIDAAYEADGWALNAAYFGRNVDNGTADVDSNGFEFGGSMFFSDQTEAYARYDILLLDDSVFTVEDTFHFLSAGVNYYLVPESHAAKLTAELGYAFEDSTGITLPGQLGGFQGNSDGEFTLSFMAQFMF